MHLILSILNKISQLHSKKVSGYISRVFLTSFLLFLASHTINAAELTSVSLTSSPLNSALFGTPVTLTATAIGGDTVQYKFMYGSLMLRDFANSNSFTWTPGYVKTYTLSVIARDINGVNPNAIVTSQPISVTTKAALTSATLTTSLNTAVTGKSITLSATAVGGVNLQYKFLNGAQVISDFSNNNSVVWNPAPGVYSLQVAIRDIFGASPYWTITSSIKLIEILPALSSVSMTTSPANAIIFGNSTTLTAVTTGGASVQYKFMYGTIVLRDFASSNSYVWTPGYIKNYGLSVIARDINGINPSATVTSAIVNIATTTALLSVALSTTPANTVVFGKSITLSATATGGINNQYKFMNGANIIRDFNSSKSFVWNPATGIYSLTVIARDANGINPNAEVVSSAKSLTISPALTAVTLATSPVNTSAFGYPVTLTATATGGLSVLYKFMLNGTILMRDFSASNSYTFTPAYSKLYNFTVIASDASGVDPNATITSASSGITVDADPGPPTGENLAETLVVDGLTRTMLVSPGHTISGNPPLVLVFHGFGGYASSMESLTHIHQLWPEATVVYPQGLNVVKPSIQYWAPGWPDFPDQYKTADAINQYHERDVHFIDALLLLMKTKYRVDQNHIYSTGFSNGASFSYLLYTERPMSFTAFAGLAGPATFLNYANISRPLLTINGLVDAYTPPALLTTMKSEFMRANQSSNIETSWPSNPIYSLYQPAVPSGAPLVWYVHPGGHSWITGASEAMIAFFKQH